MITLLYLGVELNFIESLEPKGFIDLIYLVPFMMYELYSCMYVYQSINTIV